MNSLRLNLSFNMCADLNFQMCAGVIAPTAARRRSERGDYGSDFRHARAFSVSVFVNSGCRAATLAVSLASLSMSYSSAPLPRRDPPTSALRAG
jgi:hypothetical protein